MHAHTHRYTHTHTPIKAKYKEGGDKFKDPRGLGRELTVFAKPCGLIPIFVHMFFIVHSVSKCTLNLVQYYPIEICELNNLKFSYIHIKESKKKDKINLNHIFQSMQYFHTCNNKKKNVSELFYILFCTCSSKSIVYFVLIVHIALD